MSHEGEIVYLYQIKKKTIKWCNHSITKINFLPDVKHKDFIYVCTHCYYKVISNKMFSAALATYIYCTKKIKNVN